MNTPLGLLHLATQKPVNLYLRDLKSQAPPSPPDAQREHLDVITAIMRGIEFCEQHPMTAVATIIRGPEAWELPIRLPVQPIPQLNTAPLLVNVMRLIDGRGMISDCTIAEFEPLLSAHLARICHILRGEGDSTVYAVTMLAKSRDSV